MKRMKNWNRTHILTGLSVLLIAGLAFSQGFGSPGMAPGGGAGGGMPFGRGGGPGGGFGPDNIGGFMMLAERLDLSDGQKEEVETILTDAREQMEELWESAEPAGDRMTFMELFTSPTLTVSDLEGNLGVDDGMREAARDIIFQAIVDVHDVLTEDQLEELADLVEERMAMEPMGPMGHGMMGGGGHGDEGHGGGSGPMFRR